MKIVITGGTGQIGRALVRDLINDGHQVIVLSRHPGQRRSGLPAEARLVEWDAQSAAGWLEHADGADVIINFAGQNLAGSSFLPKRWNKARKERILASRINAGRAVTEAFEKVEDKPPLLIQASASGYYGTTVSQNKKSEDDPAGEDWLAFVCQQWEAATNEVEAMGVRRIILRTGLILDAEEGVLPRLVLPFKLFTGGPLGSGEQYYPWIHIEDEVRAIRFLMDNPNASGPYNLAAPDPVKNRELASILGRVLKRPSWLPVPGFAMRLALGEVAQLVLAGQRMVPNRLQQAGFEFKHPILEAALKDLLR